MSDRELIDIALEAMKNSYSPYSHFSVGAALLCADGSVYTGCNVENASFGATNCAERTAVFKAVSEGKRDFKVIAVVGGKDGAVGAFCPPCGICRQVLAEFDAKKELHVLLFDGERAEKYKFSELLPLGFSGENVK